MPGRNTDRSVTGMLRRAALLLGLAACTLLRLWLAVLALAVVGVGTVGGSERPLGRRLLYVVGLVLVGVLIVLLELAVHLL